MVFAIMIKDDEESDVCFREDYGTFKNMLKSLAVGQRILLDADEFNHHSLHSIATMIKIKIRTKKHKTWSANWIERIK